MDPPIKISSTSSSSGFSVYKIGIGFYSGRYERVPQNHDAMDGVTQWPSTFR